MLHERYVSCNVAELLKEKGFNELCDKYINRNAPMLTEKYDAPRRNDDVTFGGEDILSAPTQQMALDWVERKGGFISVEPYADEKNFMWQYKIYHLKEKISCRSMCMTNSKNMFMTKKEATDEALMCFLSSL